MNAIALGLFAVLAMTTQPGGARSDVNARLDGGAIIKSITIPEGQNWAYVNVEVVIDAKPKAVWSALTDMARWPRWLPMNRRAETLSAEAAGQITPAVAMDQGKVQAIRNASPLTAAAEEPTGHWQRTVIEEYDLPWPIKNEWVVRRYTFDEKVDDFKASWKKIASEEKDDDGYWEVKPRDDGGKTLLRYYYKVWAKESVPQLIFKGAVSLTVNSMIKALKRESARRESSFATPASN